MQPLKVVKESLSASYNAVKLAGEKGRTLSGSQTDINTLADKEAGRAILGVLRKYPILVAYSEERGKEELKSGRSGHSAVFDDIDGTMNFKYGNGMLPYGSIIGIFNRTKPRFKDYLAAGFLEFNSGNLFYAERDKGTYLVSAWAKHGMNGDEMRISTSERKKMDGRHPPLKIVPDFYMLGSLGKHFAHFCDSTWLGDFRSSATHMALVASGAIDIFVAADNCDNPAKRRTGEELGPGYALVTEAGGAILDWKGNDIGPEEIGLDKGKPFHIVAASTRNIGLKFVESMKEIPEIFEYMSAKKLL